MNAMRIPTELSEWDFQPPLINLGVRIPDVSSVGGYLSAHPDIFDVLAEVCAEARKDFGAEAELRLELYRDPEVNDQYLTLYVRQAIYGDDIIERLDRVGLTFAERLAETSGHLLLTTDFRPPRGADAV